MQIMGKDKGGQGGTVINISSIAALSQSPLMPIYFGTKSAVLQFSTCLGVSILKEATVFRNLFYLTLPKISG